MTAKRDMIKDYTKLTLVLYGVTYSVSALPNTIQDNCKLHGLCQKLIDSTAGMNSKDYTDIERAAKIAEVWTTLKSGSWRKPEEGVAAMTKKVGNAKDLATVEEAAVMVKLGLMSEEELNVKLAIAFKLDEDAKKAKEAEEEANKPVTKLKKK